MSSTRTEATLENVLYEKKGAIAYVTLNRPKVLNALNQRTWQDLRAAFEDARADEDVRGAILTGAGDKAFIAGADISELAQVTAAYAALLKWETVVQAMLQAETEPALIFKAQVEG